MNLQRLTLLVVDDLELMRAVTVNQLREMGCERIKVARNGQDAMAILQTQPVDAVLADWSMPVMSGLELFKAMRADAKLARLPFLMITAEAERSRIEEVIAAGVSSLLVKPYTVASLRSRLEKVLGDTPRASVSTVAPARPRMAPSSLAELRPEANGVLPPTRILIADSNAQGLLELQQLFSARYAVQTAADGQTALSLCARTPEPDLLLLDVATAGLDGFEVARRVRAQPRTAQIPVIFLTDASNEVAHAKGMALGAVDYISKSTDAALLLARVANFIGFIDRRRQLQADYDALVEDARSREEAEHASRHDIKGSLAGIVGMVKSLADDETMAPRHVTQLRLVERTASQVMDMVKLGGELYKMEQGRFELKPVPVEVGAILHRIVDLSRNLYTDRNLTISVDTDTPVGVEMPMAVGDPVLCYSLFQNLIKNACEAAPNGTRVVVTLRDENPLRVLIENSGVVPPDMRNRFFDKFTTSGKAGGSGIGTYSAHTMARAQQGNVVMDTSDADHTTTLTVTLPRHIFEPT